jgi:hypothetical protein
MTRKQLEQITPLKTCKRISGQMASKDGRLGIIKFWTLNLSPPGLKSSQSRPAFSCEIESMSHNWQHPCSFGKILDIDKKTT